MRCHSREKVARPQKHKSREEPKQTRIQELKGTNRPCQNPYLRRSKILSSRCLRLDDLHKVMNMRDSENQRTREDDPRWGSLGKQIEGYDEGSEDEFLTPWRYDHIPMAGWGGPEC